MKVGITGHQDLGNAAKAQKIENILRDVIIELKPAVGYTSLAIGADQLFADELMKASIPFIAIIPCEDYEYMFKKTDYIRYKEILKKACQVDVLPYPGPTEEAFFAAGKSIVEAVNVLIAIWDGKPAKGLGGTADVVKYGLKLNRKVIHIDTKEFAIKEL